MREYKLPDDYVEIGALGQSHGLKGEINLQIDQDLDLVSGDFIFVDIDGLLIPYEIESLRKRGADGYLVKFRSVDNPDQTSSLRNCRVFLNAGDKGDFKEDEDDRLYISDLIGFEVTCNGHSLGVVIDFDDSTANCLLVLEDTDAKKLMIPFVDEYIAAIEVDKKLIEVDLPSGFQEAFL